MRRRPLGRTGVEVSQMGLGGVFLSSAATDAAHAHAAVRRALELGINLFDTAPSYHDSEVVLGQALREGGAACVVATKIGGGHPWFAARDHDALRRSVDESLRRLGRASIDLLLVHEPDRKTPHDWWEDPDTAAGPVMDVLAQLKAAGVVRHLGLGGTTAYAMARLIRTGQFDVVLTAFQYSLLWRVAAHALLPAAQAAGMGILVGSPLQQGVLASRRDAELSQTRALSLPRRRQFQALYALLDELGMELPELALRFVVSNPAVDAVLVGARNAAEVERGVAAVRNGPLPGSVLERLDAIYRIAPFRPHGEALDDPFRRAPGAL
jgi:aryl-alcohol dehydrogenase-like predicted oxidoreductase